AARVHTVEHGRDIEHFTMIAFGGGAPLHASRLCEKLGIDRLIVPPGAGVGSAIGFLRAPFSYEATRGLYQPLDGFNPDQVNAMVAELEAEAGGFVSDGAGDAETQTRLTAFMRYAGQGWEIAVPLSQTRFSVGDGQNLLAGFESAYRTLFGRTIEGLAVEITNWALTVATATPPTKPVIQATDLIPAPPVRQRGKFDAALRKTVMAQEVQRADMHTGSTINGPAVITEEETSTIITSAFRATCQADGALLIERKEARP
ncbi:MAG: hydantoinase/oxoprolinase family protein, partial [Pseudomonadota bacterium]